MSDLFERKNKLVCSISGWNSLERLAKDSEHQNEKIYLREGFTHFLEKAFVEKISEEKIQFNSLVKRISVHENDQYVEMEVITNNQILTYRADHVVCTLSVGCLKHSMHQVFVPALPHAKRMCVQKLGFGTINRVGYNDRREDGRNIDLFRFIWFLLSRFGTSISKHSISSGIQIEQIRNGN